MAKLRALRLASSPKLKLCRGCFRQRRNCARRSLHPAALQLLMWKLTDTEASFPSAYENGVRYCWSQNERSLEVDTFRFVHESVRLTLWFASKTHILPCMCNHRCCEVRLLKCSNRFVWEESADTHEGKLHNNSRIKWCSNCYAHQ